MVGDDRGVLEKFDYICGRKKERIMLSNNKKKQIQQLGQKKQRDQQGLFIAEGAKITADLIRGGLTPVFIAGLADAISQHDFRARCGEVVECDEREMRDVSLQKTPSKLIAIFKKPTFVRTEVRPRGLTIVLDEIQDPGNMGTIIRIADWFGIRRIICSDTCADAYSPKTVQASMGAIARVEVEETDLGVLLETNRREWQMPVYGTLLEGDNIYKTDVEQEGFIVMGNEGKGISERLKPYITHKLFIPSYPQGVVTSESLNVAAATAIVCSEFRRRTF